MSSKATCLKFQSQSSRERDGQTDRILGIWQSSAGEAHLTLCFAERLSVGQEAGEGSRRGGTASAKDGSGNERSGTPLAKQVVPNSQNFGHSE